MNTKKICLLLTFLSLSISLFSQVAGTKKWEFLTGSSIYSSPAIGADGTIYIGSYDKKLYAINPDGAKKWEFLTGSYIYSSPAIGADGTIYVGSDDNKLYAINPDGTKKWEYLTGGDVRSSPAIGADGTIYVGSYDDKLYAINPDGTKKWEYFFSIGGYIYYSSPAIGSDGTIYVGSYDNKLYAINPDGTKKWEYITGGDVESSPAIGTDGTIYVGSDDNKLYAINPNGTKKWDYLTGADVGSSPAIGADGTIYIGSYDKKLYAINPDGAKKWEFLTGSYIYSSPAIGADGTIYVGSDDNKLYAINPDGTKKWEYLTVGDVRSSPAIGADGTISVGSNDYKLYAIISTSNGLVNSSWPKFKHDNFNRGLVNDLSVLNTDFSNMVLPGQSYNFKTSLFSSFNSNIIITAVHINDFDFGLVTSLPVTVVPGIKQELSFSITEPNNKWYTPRISIDFSINGATLTRVYKMEGFVFLNDESELAHTANQVMPVWKALDRSNEILLNNTKGVMYRLLNEYSAAEKCFSLALRKALNARYSYDGILMNTGVVKSDMLITDSASYFYAGALKDLQTTATTSVLAPQIYYNQAWEAYTNTKYADASTLALQTINHTKANNYLKAKAYTLLGAIRFLQERTSDATDAFNLAISLDNYGPIGKMAQANLEMIISTDIDQDMGTSDINLYPNPGDGKLTLSIGNLQGILELNVFKSTGEKVFSDRLTESAYSSVDLDLSHLNNGVYFIRITSDNFVYTEKIVIIK